MPLSPDLLLFWTMFFGAPVLNHVVFLSCRSTSRMSFFLLFTLPLYSTKSTIYDSPFFKNNLLQ
jgi:hypothetical protein